MYRLTTSDAIIRVADSASIPHDQANTDWQEYQQWLAAGNTPAPAPVVDRRLAVLSDFRTRRETYLDRLAGIAVFADDLAVKAAAKTFRQRLLDIPQDASVTGAVDAAALELAILTLYRAAAMEAVAAAPTGKAEFDRIAK